jgi:flagellar biosynthesis protein FliQ
MGEGVTYTIANVITALQSVYSVLIGLFTNVITTITSNPLLFVPVLIALLGGLVFFAVRVIRKLGRWQDLPGCLWRG